MYKQLARNLQYKISVQYMLKDKSMHRILPKLNLKRYKTSLTVLPYSIALECLLLYSCVKFAKRGHFSDDARHRFYGNDLLTSQKCGRGLLTPPT